MISTARLNSQGSPSSLMPSKCSRSTRSVSNCEILRSLAPDSFFLSSIQNIGGTFGFSGVRSVRFTLALPALDEISSFLAPSLERIESTNSSLDG